VRKPWPTRGGLAASSYRGVVCACQKTVATTIAVINAKVIARGRKIFFGSAVLLGPLEHRLFQDLECLFRCDCHAAPLAFKCLHVGEVFSTRHDAHELHETIAALGKLQAGQ
jgi:hypothetical protein